MPPRRSCFHLGEGRRGARSRFQCHHGVPASEDLQRLGSQMARFNATTAFLLPYDDVVTLKITFSFNATTAFLLPPPSTWPR